MVRVKRCRHGDMAFLSNDLYIGRSLDWYGEYSEGEVDLFRRLVQPGFVILEIGANIGAHTVPLAQFAGPTGRVDAYEPQRFLFYLLCANVVLNNLTNVVCHQAAVAEAAGAIHVPEMDYDEDRNFGGLNLEDGLGQRFYEVPVLRVDDLQLEQCDLIKIDVEGMELRVLQGAHDTIARFRPFLYLEDDRWDRSRELRAFVEGLGYECHRHLPLYFNPDNFAGNADNVLGPAVSGNLLCCHRERPAPFDLQTISPEGIQDPFVGKWMKHGVTLGGLGRLTEAEAAFREVLRLFPSSADGHFNLGLALDQQGRLEEAAASYQQALAIQPERPDALNNLGNVGNIQKTQGNLDTAIDCYQAILRFRPDYAEVWYNLGIALSEQGRLDDAVAAYQKALRLHPVYAEAYSNLGIVLARRGQLDEALACHQKAIAVRPEYSDGHSNLGSTLAERGHFDEALACYEQALRIKPDNATAHFNFAHLLLLRGDFEHGWSEYEWRRKRPGFEPYPEWNGTPLEGRTILLHHEQGFGDTVQFLRYAPLLQRQGGKVVLECQPALLSLAATCRGIDQLVASGDILPSFSMYAPLASLPRLFGTNLSNIPADTPYLEADPARLASWRARLARERRFKIGIVWQGSREHRRDSARSVPLTAFAPLSQVPGVALFSLQVGTGSEQLVGAGLPITDLGSRFDSSSFADLAAMLVNLDLLISVDSAPVHVAGALGIPVWVALQYLPDWRWLLDRSDSPWYPSMRLFRQEQPGNWRGVFERIAVELEKAVERISIRSR